MSGPSDPLHVFTDDSVSGNAALSLIEALVLTLLDRRVVSEHEIDAMFEAAIAAHRAKSQRGYNQTLHEKIVAVLQRMQAESGASRSDEI